MNSLKFSFSFEVGGVEVVKEIETTQEQIKEALQGKIWRSAVVLKNSFNAKLEENAKLVEWAKTNELDQLRVLQDNKNYLAEVKELSSKIELKEKPSEKTESDFLDLAIKKVFSGGGQND